ncbi:hypothetical protein PC116_g31159, partial [Phytophthora cactorum]
MRNAAQTGEVDALFQAAVNRVRSKSNDAASPAGNEANLLDADFDDGGPSVAEQIARVEDILKKLNLVQRERNQVLKDLKEKSIPNFEKQLFQSELEKFRPHQARILQANHKQASLLKELQASFGHLLQDKRVRSERS